MKPVVLCILDGWGMRDETTANAVALADTPNFDRIWKAGPSTLLTAHGEDVGLPPGQMGNSEVGHMNIGAGRVVWMDLPRINNAIADKSFFTNPALAEALAKAKAAGGRVHIAGLVSDGGVHAHSDHIVALAQAVTDAGLDAVIHAYLDGRDVAPKSALGFLEDLTARLPQGATIGTACGRFFAMDRDNRWDRVKQAFDLMVSAQGAAYATAQEAVAAVYVAGETDEFVPASVIGDYAGMADGDALIFANFRADRAREILSALLDPAFDGFDAGKRPKLSAACGMVSYSDSHDAFMGVMFPSAEIVNTLGAWVAQHGRAQLRLAETEKYPHVTFFMNGGIEEPNRGEDRKMAASPKVKTYDMQPEMSAGEVTDALVAGIEGQAHDLILINYANPDMVGHTGDLDAAMAACAAVDAGLGRVLAALDKVGGAMIVTADHGNCEMMVDPQTGGPHTAHTLNPVPVVLVGSDAGALRSGGRLADLAPTLLALLGLPQPDEMTGESLIAT